MRSTKNMRQLKDIAQIRAAQTLAAQFKAQTAMSTLRSARTTQDAVEAACTDSETQWRKAFEKPSLPIDDLIAWSAETQRQNAKLEVAHRDVASKRHSNDKAQMTWHVADVHSTHAQDAVRAAFGRTVETRDEILLDDVLEKIAFRGGLS